MEELEEERLDSGGVQSAGPYSAGCTRAITYRDLAFALLNLTTARVGPLPVPGAFSCRESVLSPEKTYSLDVPRTHYDIGRFILARQSMTLFTISIRPSGCAVLDCPRS